MVERSPYKADVAGSIPVPPTNLGNRQKAIVKGEIKNYKDLIVWQKSHEAILLSIELLECLPKNQILNVISVQFLRSISSVSANIAEGFGSYSSKKYRRYLNIALKSAHESDNWIQIFKDSKKLTNGLQKDTLEKIEKLNK